MVLHLTPEQEGELVNLAAHTGKPVEQLLSDAAVSIMRESRLFLDAVEKGIAAADRDEFIEEDDGSARWQHVARLMRFRWT